MKISSLYPLILGFSVFFVNNVLAQKSYKDSLEEYRNRYIDSHSVVKEDNKQYFDFFEADSNLRVLARYEPVKKGNWFTMKTSGTKDKLFKTVGKLHFPIHGQEYTLHVYQPQNLSNDPELADYLFIPFTDNTNGESSYEGGRYLELTVSDIRNRQVVLDFNKAYNPLCVYADGFNCPIPPAENYLSTAITAGEKKFQRRLNN